LTIANPQARARCVATPGWHGGAYVLPDAVIGEADGERFVLQASAPLHHAFRCTGTLDGWREAIGKPAMGNSRLVLSISMAFAAPLLRALGIEGGGLHWRGGSSTGKTTMGERSAVAARTDTRSPGGRPTTVLRASPLSTTTGSRCSTKSAR
jgi:putative DNA primase/helicase